MCQDEGGRNIGGGGEDSCEMRIQADQSDHGSWTCMLTLAKDYHSTTTYLGMDVAVRPRLSICQHHHGLDGHDGQAGLVGQAVHMLGGQQYSFTCLAEQGFPRPVFYWSVGNTSAMMRLHADNEVR